MEKVREASASQPRLRVSEKVKTFVLDTNVLLHDPQSIFNADGAFGSKTNRNSIWNAKGPYGDRASAFSPWNRHGASPPLLKDEYDHAHGYFSANAAIAGRTTDPAMVRFLKIWSERLAE